MFEWAIALTIFCAVSSNEGFRGGSAPRRNESIFGGLKAWRLKQFPAYLNRWDSQQARNEGVFAH